MARAKKDKVANAAAAAAAAAVRASQAAEDTKLLLNWSADGDDEDDQELTDEILAGLEKIDEAEGAELCWWELYCDSPLASQGQIRKLATPELRGLRDECLTYGPGEYHVVARRKSGTFVKGSRLRIKISGLAKPGNGAMTTQAPAAVDPMLLLERLDQRQDQRRREEKAARDQQIRFWAPILAPIGVELAKGLFGRSSGESVKDIVQAMVGMKDLVGKGGGSSDIDALLKGMELARDMTPEKGSTWPDMLVNGLRELRPSLEALANRRNGTGATTPATPQAVTFKTAQATAPAAVTDARPTNPETPEDPMWAMITPLLQKLSVELEEFAINGADAGLAAEALLAKVPRMIRNQVTPQQMKEWLTQANWWEVLVKFHPGVQSHQGFCDDVRLTLLQMAEDQINPPPDDAGEAGAE